MGWEKDFAEEKKRKRRTNTEEDFLGKEYGRVSDIRGC